MRHGFGSRLAAAGAAGLLLVGAAALPAAAAAPRLAPVSLLLDWLPNTDHAGVYAARALGMYRAQGLDVHVIVPGNATDALEEVATGHYDFAISYEPDVLLACRRGLPVEAVMAIVDRPLNTVLTLRSSGIRSLKELRGKTVGITGVPSDYAVMHALEAFAHLPRSSVRLATVGYNLLPALLHGAVQAVEGVYWTWEAVELAQQGHPVRVFHIERLGVPTYDELVLVTSDHLARTDPSLVRRFVAATVRGYAYAHAHPQRAATLLLRQVPSLSAKLVRASMNLLAPAFDYRVSRIGEMPPSQWRRYLAWMVAERLIRPGLTVSRAMTDAFLPR
jgi:putative hydroxymethylpyrimidine transport system substrate-binding protein